MGPSELEKYISVCDKGTTYCTALASMQRRGSGEKANVDKIRYESQTGNEKITRSRKDLVFIFCLN